MNTRRTGRDLTASALAILLSAILLFLVQPIIAKQILPWFGGSAAVWTSCMVFFQMLLLAGYAYAHWLTQRCPARLQANIHITLLLVSLAFLPIIPALSWKPMAGDDPLWRILGLLAATIGLPYFLLSSTGPLMQKWLSRDAQQTSPGAVYRLFALSNFGSLAGLLAYPFAVEPYASAAQQSWAWSIAYGAFVLACSACAWRARRPVRLVQPVQAAGESVMPHGPAPRLPDTLYWIVCAALGSVLLLAVTSHITQNIASIPFLWVLPLSLYLLSFIVCFEGRGGRGWYVRSAWLLPAMLAAVAMSWGLSAHNGVLHIHVAIPLFAGGLFLACMLCHGELAATKPAPAHLTHFYLALSAGGALGGLLVALVAPRVFDNLWETPLSLIALSCLGGIAAWRGQRPSATPLPRGRAVVLGIALGVGLALMLLGASGDLASAVAQVSGWKIPERLGGLAILAWWAAGAALLCFFALRWRAGPALALAALLCTGVFGWKYHHLLAQDTVLMSRDFYGTLRVRETPPPYPSRRLMHGVILHGEQFLTPGDRLLPTTYYGPTSGVGLTLRHLRPDGTARVVGLIGMGAGTLTAYGHAGDVFRIYELDPAVLHVAQTAFTYLAECKARVEPVLGDARLSIEREVAAGKFTDPAARYDVLVVDAFSSDAIPVHLITREALALYARALKPDGVVAFHVTNRYLDLAPVVAQIGADAGFDVRLISDEPDDTDPRYSRTDWVLVTRNRALLADPALADVAERVAQVPDLRIWTDQFNNLFEILK